MIVHPTIGYDLHSLRQSLSTERGGFTIHSKSAAGRYLSTAVVGLVVENVQVARWIFYLAAVVLQPCWQKNRLIPNLG